MREKYHYIVAGLPQLILQFENSGHPISSLIDSILEQIYSSRERRAVEWLLFGFNQENLTNHFYRGALNYNNSFIREYFSYDLLIRNMQVLYLATKESLDPTPFFVGQFDPNELPQEAEEISTALEEKNIVVREHSIDRLRWNRATELTLFNYFDIDALLAIITKLEIIKRWDRLDKERGAELFKEFVNEVRGSFKFEYNL